MNFAPFTGHIPSAAAMPSIQQFAAKLGYEAGGAGQERYPGVQLAPPAAAPGATKYRAPDTVLVVSPPHPPSAPAVALAPVAPLHTVNSGVKYQSLSTSSTPVMGNIAYGSQPIYVQETVLQSSKTEQRERRDFREDMQQDIMASMMQQQVSPTTLQQGQQLMIVLHEPKEAAAIARALKNEGRAGSATANEFISIGDVTDSSTWQSLGGGVADYLSALPLPLHQLLKYSAPATSPAPASAPAHIVEAKREHTIIATVAQEPSPQPSSSETSVVVATSTAVAQLTADSQANVAPTPNLLNIKKKKKKSSKEKKPRPRPGEIRTTTALDGSTLYCCPECHMAYPERGLLEQHLLGHTMERRFICDICNAALKRKDHLTRHKQSHSAARPHVCAVCLKAFKRKEQLTLHFVIHSGEKRHVCNECGKGFYRKDHLRKHTRSHIARRVKAEMCAGGETGEEGEAALPPPVPAPQPPPS